jgi:integrase
LEKDMKLKAAQINGMTCREGQKQTKVHDSDGLYLLIKQTSGDSTKKNKGKLWRFRYKYGGKHKEMALGKYPDITLAVAREKAGKARHSLMDGVDPMAERKIKKYQFSDDNLHFGKVAMEWFDSVKNGWSDSYQTKLLRWLENDLKHLLTLHINLVTKKHVINLVQAIVKSGYKKKVEPMISMINRIFIYADSKELSNSNPCVNLDYKTIVGYVPPAEGLAAITDSRKLGKLLCDIEENCHGTQCPKEALKLLPHLFLRPGELRLLKWEYVDFDKKIMFLPAEIMKARKDHLVPMSKQVTKMLKYLFEITNYSEFVFPSEINPCQPFSKNVLNNRLKELGYDGNTMVAHGFRSTASTLLNELGVNGDHIEVQLAHQIGNRTSRTYNRSQFLKKREKMMQRWSDLLDELKDKSFSDMLKAA